MAPNSPRKMGLVFLLLLKPALAQWMGFGFPRYATSVEEWHQMARDDTWHPHLNLFEDGMLNLVFSADVTNGMILQENMGPFRFCEPVPDSYLCDGNIIPPGVIDTSQDEPLGTKNARKVYFESTTWMEPSLLHIGSKRRWVEPLRREERWEMRPNPGFPGLGWTFYKFPWLPNPEEELGVHCGNYCHTGYSGDKWWEPDIFDGLWITWRGRLYNVPEHCNVVWRRIVQAWFNAPRQAHRAHCALPIGQDVNETGSKVWKCEELGKCYVAQQIDKWKD